MTKKEIQKIHTFRNKVRRSTQKCYNPNCSENAIRSHILQVEGPIREISSTSSKLIQLDICSPHEKCRYKFREVGIKDRKGDVLNFWGFCNSCDSNIFSPIENGNVDFSIYKNQLLCSYRGFLSELYKQEYNLKHFELILKDKEISERTKKRYNSKNQHFIMIVNNSRFYKSLFDKEIFRKKNRLLDLFVQRKRTQNFIFSHYELDRIEICSSTCYAFPGNKVPIDKIKLLSNFKYYDPISSLIFFSLIPQKDKTILIVGTNKTKPDYKTLLIIKYLDEATMEQRLKYVSDVLIKHVETWFLSTQYYNKLSNTKKDKKIIKNIERYFHNSMKRKDIEFNMFK